MFVIFMKRSAELLGRGGALSAKAVEETNNLIFQVQQQQANIIQG